MACYLAQQFLNGLLVIGFKVRGRILRFTQKKLGHPQDRGSRNAQAHFAAQGSGNHDDDAQVTLLRRRSFRRRLRQTFHGEG